MNDFLAAQAAEEQALRRQKLAEVLRQQAFQPLQGRQVGRVYVGPGLAGALGQLLQTHASAEGIRRAESEVQDARQAQNTAEQSAWNRYTTTNYGGELPVQGPATENGPLPTQTVEADPRKALADAMSSGVKGLSDFAGQSYRGREEAAIKASLMPGTVVNGQLVHPLKFGDYQDKWSGPFVGLDGSIVERNLNTNAVRPVNNVPTEAQVGRTEQMKKLVETTATASVMKQSIDATREALSLLGSGKIHSGLFAALSGPVEQVSAALRGVSPEVESRTRKFYGLVNGLMLQSLRQSDPSPTDTTIKSYMEALGAGKTLPLSAMKYLTQYSLSKFQQLYNTANNAAIEMKRRGVQPAFSPEIAERQSLPQPAKAPAANQAMTADDFMRQFGVK